jgi:hypothetical protein
MNFTKFLSPLLFTAFVICFSSGITFAQQSTSSISPTKATFRDDHFAYNLSDKDFANTPSWNQDEGEPPLSLSQAVKIARESVPRFVNKADNLKIREITLQSMGNNKWFYRVKFVCFGMQCRGQEVRGFTAIVKLDGTIIEPKKVKIEE